MPSVEIQNLFSLAVFQAARLACLLVLMMTPLLAQPAFAQQSSYINDIDAFLIELEKGRIERSLRANDPLLSDALIRDSILGDSFVSIADVRSQEGTKLDRARDIWSARKQLATSNKKSVSSSATERLLSALPFSSVFLNK